LGTQGISVQSAIVITGGGQRKQTLVEIPPALENIHSSEEALALAAEKMARRLLMLMPGRALKNLSPQLKYLALL